jgi:succinyl-CoA synthetase beta subunit
VRDVDLMEYQAKELFAKHGVTTTLGIVVTTPEEARAAAEKLGFCVVKAQVKAGGRGKAGGVKLAKTADEAVRARRRTSSGWRSRGSGQPGAVTPATPPEEEYYFSFLLDRANRQYLCIASVEGGVEIEEVAKTNPDAVKQIPVDPAPGVDAAEGARRSRPRRSSPSRSSSRPSTMIEALYRSSSRRTPRWSRSTRSRGSRATSSRRSTARSPSTTTRPRSGTPTTRRSRSRTRPTRSRPRPRRRGLNYVKLDGEVGIIGNGAGLVMSTLDVVAYAGESTAASSRPTSSTSAAAPTRR